MTQFVIEGGDCIEVKCEVSGDKVLLYVNGEEVIVLDLDDEDKVQMGRIGSVNKAVIATDKNGLIKIAD